jgi:myo-inositol-1(or 4)-monophosphatase
MDRDLARARRLAVDLAVEAGRLQVVRRSSVVVGDTKSHANDLVSDVDLASERLIVDGISAEWRGDGILAEEGSSAPSTSGWRWVIDPLDGTRNYLTGAGPWSVCIALQQAGATRMAVVHDPVAGETFSAVAGAGAELDGAAMAVSSTARVDEAIVGLSFDPSPATKRRMVGLVSALLPAIGDVRRVPAALALAYAAAGRFDAAVMVDTKPWDVAAGLLLAAEAGAVVGKVPGAGPELILAAPPALRPELERLIPASA